MNSDKLFRRFAQEAEKRAKDESKFLRGKLDEARKEVKRLKEELAAARAEIEPLLPEVRRLREKEFDDPPSWALKPMLGDPAGHKEGKYW